MYRSSIFIRYIGPQVVRDAIHNNTPFNPVVASLETIESGTTVLIRRHYDPARYNLYLNNYLDVPRYIHYVAVDNTKYYTYKPPLTVRTKTNLMKSLELMNHINLPFICMYSDWISHASESYKIKLVLHENELEQCIHIISLVCRGSILGTPNIEQDNVDRLFRQIIELFKLNPALHQEVKNQFKNIDIPIISKLFTQRFASMVSMSEEFKILHAMLY